MKKQLLNESEIRKLMKFANIGSLTETFVEKLDESYFLNEQPEEEEDVEGVPPDTGEEDIPMEPDAAPEDELGDVDMIDDEGGDESVLEGVKTAIEALKRGLEEMGLQEAADAITLEMTDEEGEEDLGADEEFPPEEGGEEMPPVDMGPPPEEGEEEEDVPPPPPMEEGLMNEVLTRVVKRLRRATRKRR